MSTSAVLALLALGHCLLLALACILYGGYKTIANRLMAFLLKVSLHYYLHLYLPNEFPVLCQSIANCFVPVRKNAKVSETRQVERKCCVHRLDQHSM